MKEVRFVLNTFYSIFETTTLNMGTTDFVVCILFALVIGLIQSKMYMYKSNYTEGFVITLATLPAVIAVVIIMVNGNVGAGVAVAGAFSLVRFRSVPGTAKEIGAIFMAMGTGLIIGMGYLLYALIFTLIIGLVNMAYTKVNFGADKRKLLNKTLKITIPEDLNYTEVFDDLLTKYTNTNELVRVKTTNMGSLFTLTYNITLKELTKEKEFIDELRTRNANLEINITKQEMVTEL